MPDSSSWDADAAVEELYAAHYRRLVRLSVLLVRDVETAEEVVQDAFVAMHGRWSRLEDPDRALAYAFTHEAPARGIEVLTLAGLVAAVPATHEVRVHQSSWSCAHGVGRWKEDCGCSTGGQSGWNQAWRGPFRRALDILAEEAERCRRAVISSTTAS